MFVRSRGVWCGFVEKMFMFCSAKSRKLVFLAKTNVSLLYIHLRTMAGHYGFLRRPVVAVVFVSNKFMSSYIICLVTAKEIFLFQSDFSSITKVHNFSP